jgi:hypothetical protein
MSENELGVRRVPVYVSLADMVALQSLLDDETVGLERVLTEVFGFDNKVAFSVNNSWYESMVCEHRSRGGKIVTCERFVGLERMDDKWLKSGYASEDVKLMAKDDASLVGELERLSGRSIGKHFHEGTKNRSKYEGKKK